MSPFQNIFDAPAMLSTEERLALTHAAGRLAPGSTIVDLGTSAGGSAFLFRHASPGSRVYTIDINDKLLRGPFEDPGLSVYRGNGREFVADHPDLRADLVFIDASHYFFDVADDYQVISGIMKDGAIIAFHDCIAPKFPGISVLCKTLADNGNIRDVHVFHSLFVGEFNADAPFPDAELFVENMGEFGEMLNMWVPASPVFSRERTALFERIFNSLKQGTDDALWIVGQGRRGQDFADFVGFDAGRLVHSSEVQGDDPVCVVCSYYYGEISGFLQKEKNVRPDSAIDANELIQFGFYQDLAFNRGQASLAMANTDFQREILGLLTEQPERRLRRLYEYGCLENILEDVFIR